jgi:hypothetical protein
MPAKCSESDDGFEQIITVWADSIIESAKQLMLDRKAYLLAVSGLPWYRKGGDAWVDEQWWIEAAQFRYENAHQFPNRWVINELEILTQHFPEKYRDEARLRIDQWYKESAHDPENWWGLALAVYPEHPIFQDLYDGPTENHSERAILASLGHKDFITHLRNDLLTECKRQDWLCVSDILARIAGAGGLSLVNSIVSESELQYIRQSFKSLAERQPKDVSNRSFSEQEFNEIQGQTDCIKAAVQLGWQDVIDSLSENQSHLERLNIFDMHWWSLTNKKQIVKRFVVRKIKTNPQIFQNNKVSRIEPESMALAIAWKRATST